jgi:hypothetical protein
MRKDKSLALELRKTGKSYEEIKASLGIPKSTLSDWLHKSGWSKRIKEDLNKKLIEKNRVNLKTLNGIYRTRLAMLYGEARQEAAREFEHLKLHPLFTAAIGIYLGEGDRSSKNTVRVCNVDPNILRIFIAFMKYICGMQKEKIRIHVLTYPDLDGEECKRFWMKELGLKNTNFNKCVEIKGRHKTRRLKYGVCNVTISSTYLKEKMNVWTQLLPRELANKEYYAGVVQQ